MKFTDRELRGYIQGVREQKTLAEEISRISRFLILLEVDKPSNYADQLERLTQLFQALLTEKAREESVDQMRENDRARAQNPSPSPAYHPGSGIRIRHILQQ